MNLGRLRRRFGISAARVAVTAHVPWYMRVIVTAAFVLFILLMAAWVFDIGRKFAGFDSSQSSQKLEELQSSVIRLSEESVRLRDQVVASESELQIEKTAQANLAGQIRTLESENNRLREELAVFERLAAAGPKATGVSIHRLEVEPESEAGHYRYRMLLSALGGQGKDFQGRLRLIATVVTGINAAMIDIPVAGGDRSGQSPLIFKHFRRIEGSFSLPVGSRLQSLEVSVLQEGSVLATQRVAP